MPGKNFSSIESLDFGIKWETLRSEYFKSTGQHQLSSQCAKKSVELESKLKQAYQQQS